MTRSDIDATIPVRLDDRNHPLDPGRHFHYRRNHPLSVALSRHLDRRVTLCQTDTPDFRGLIACVSLHGGPRADRPDGYTLRIGPHLESRLRQHAATRLSIPRPPAGTRVSAPVAQKIRRADADVEDIAVTIADRIVELHPIPSYDYIDCEPTGTRIDDDIRQAGVDAARARATLLAISPARLYAADYARGLPDLPTPDPDALSAVEAIETAYATAVSTGQSDRYGHTDIEMHSLDFRGGGIDADAITDRLEASTDRRNTPRP